MVGRVVVVVQTAMVPPARWLSVRVLPLAVSKARWPSVLVVAERKGAALQARAQSKAAMMPSAQASVRKAVPAVAESELAPAAAVMAVSVAVAAVALEAAMRPVARELAVAEA